MILLLQFTRTFFTSVFKANGCRFFLPIFSLLNSLCFLPTILVESTNESEIKRRKKKQQKILTSSQIFVSDYIRFSFSVYLNEPIHFILY